MVLAWFVDGDLQQAIARRVHRRFRLPGGHLHQDYEYHGLMAATWDLFRGDTSDWADRFFFRELIRRSGQPALDVGCGTGRLLLDYLASGLDVDGVDISPDMLALCRQRAAERGLSPRLYQQSMDELDLPRRYRTIIVPSSSFQLVLDPVLAVEAMRRFHAHLLPGGSLATPFMSIWEEGDPLERDWEPTGEQVRPEDGAVVRRWSRTWYDPASQLEYTEDRYEVSLPAVDDVGRLARGQDQADGDRRNADLAPNALGEGHLESRRAREPAHGRGTDQPAGRAVDRVDAALL